MCPLMNPNSSALPKRWWLTPLIFTLVFAAGLVLVCMLSVTAREVLAKAFMTVAGTLATPFFLETSVALVGLVAVLVYNQWRRSQEEDEWVYLATTTPDPQSLAEGADAPAHRLDAVVLRDKPDPNQDLATRLAMVEGFLELGLKKEALDHLAHFSEEERSTERVRALQAQASL